jgi:hypothetical protein
VSQKESESEREGACNIHTQMEREHILYRENTLWTERTHSIDSENIFYIERTLYIERTHFIQRDYIQRTHSM